MITAGLFRHALRRSLRWRVLLVFWGALLLPSALALLPAFAFLRGHLDHSTRAQDVVAWMDGATAIDLVLQLGTDSAARPLLLGMIGALLALLVTAPFSAAAMVAASASGEPLPLLGLLAAAGGLYGRMLRVALVALVPLGAALAVAGGVGKLALRANERVGTEGAADRNLLLAAAGAAAVLFVAHLVADAARAQFAADLSRRSAIGALIAAARLMARRPVRSAALGALGAAVGFGGAAIFMSARLRIAQDGPVTLGLAWMLAQGAQLAIGWGRAVRIEGLAELLRVLAAERDRARGSEPTHPEGGPHTEVVESATLSALEPPRSGAPR